MARILALEDQPDYLALMISWIKALGHTPITATHAEDALRLIDSCHPDLMLCDIRLPGPSGYEVVGLLKSQAATRHIPVVAVTAFSPWDEAVVAGFDGYLAKPFSFAGLQAEVERFLSEGSQTARPEQAPGTGTPWRKTGLPRTGKRILVVDNTSGNRDLMETILDYGGHEVICVATIARALAVARAERIDLILSDVHLDDERRGTELFRAVQDDPDLHGIRFVFTSATRGASIEKEVLQCGASGFLRMPMTPVALLKAIDKLLA